MDLEFKNCIADKEIVAWRILICCCFHSGPSTSLEYWQGLHSLQEVRSLEPVIYLRPPVSATRLCQYLLPLHLVPVLSLASPNTLPVLYGLVQMSILESQMVSGESLLHGVSAVQQEKDLPFLLYFAATK